MFNWTVRIEQDIATSKCSFSFYVYADVLNTKTSKSSSLLSLAFLIVNFKLACISFNFSKKRISLTVIFEDGEAIVYISFIIKWRKIFDKLIFLKSCNYRSKGRAHRDAHQSVCTYGCWSWSQLQNKLLSIVLQILLNLNAHVLVCDQIILLHKVVYFPLNVSWWTKIWCQMSTY